MISAVVIIVAVISAVVIVLVIWMVKSHMIMPAQEDVAMQAQCCIFLFNYASFQDSSKGRAARAGAVSAVCVGYTATTNY